MSWVVGLVWGIAVLIALVVLGYCALDLRFKAGRLSRDAARLNELQDDLAALQRDLAQASRRLPRPHSGG